MLAYVNAFIFPAAFALLPAGMDTPEARAHCCWRSGCRSRASRIGAR
jgi:hypothetical protein